MIVIKAFVMVVLVQCLISGSVQAEEAKVKTEEGSYAFYGYSMAVPENFSLHSIYGCLTLDIYTQDRGIKKSALDAAEHSVLYRAVCNTEYGDIGLSFDIESKTDSHYIVSSVKESATVFRDRATVPHFNELFSSEVLSYSAAFDEASFLLAQVSDQLLQELGASEVEDELVGVAAVTANVSRDARYGVSFNGNYFGRVLDTTGTIRAADIGTGSSCNNTARAFTAAFGSGNCGHIIARNLGGSGVVTTPSRTQIFPQNPSINSGAYNQWEQRIAAYIRGGCSVNASIRFYYSGASVRPRSISYRIYRGSSAQACINDFVSDFGQTNYATMSFQN